MRGDPTLFDAAGAEPAAVPGSSADGAWSVGGLNAAVRAALSVAFPDRVWVRGEVVGMKKGRNGHVYFDLVDHPAGADRPTAQIASVAFAGRWRTVEWRLQRARIRLDDGMQVCFRGRVEVFEPQGRLQLVVDDVDPEWTLGHMAAGRDRVLRVLAAEGLLDTNAALPLPAVPLVVGLVTSVGSAAYNDFVQELAQSGYGFRVLAVDGQTQGAGTVASTVCALRTLSRCRVDVVALVRGGGARTDLAWFDDEQIARTIATMPVPVVTGIGHEIDMSVADTVAHTCRKTPTSAASLLVASVAEFDARLERSWRRIADVSGDRTAQAEVALAERGGRVPRAAAHRVESLDARLRGLGASVRRNGRALLARTDVRLEAARSRLLPVRLSRRLDTCAASVADAAGRVPRRARRRLDSYERRLDACGQAVRAYDPARVLERGFSLTLDGSGRVVRDASSLTPGQVVRTRFARGAAASRVIEVDGGEA